MNRVSRSRSYLAAFDRMYVKAATMAFTSLASTTERQSARCLSLSLSRSIGVRTEIRCRGPFGDFGILFNRATRQYQASELSLSLVCVLGELATYIDLLALQVTQHSTTEELDSHRRLQQAANQSINQPIDQAASEPASQPASDARARTILARIEISLSSHSGASRSPHNLNLYTRNARKESTTAIVGW